MTLMLEEYNVEVEIEFNLFGICSMVSSSENGREPSGSIRAYKFLIPWLIINFWRKTARHETLMHIAGKSGEKSVLWNCLDDHVETQEMYENFRHDARKYGSLHGIHHW